MSKKTLYTILVISLICTSMTPFLFDAKYLVKPNHSYVYHGAPFPFFQSFYQFPDDPNQYPITIDFQFAEASFSFVPYILSFISIFLLIFSLYWIIARFFRKDPKI